MQTIFQLSLKNSHCSCNESLTTCYCWRRNSSSSICFQIVHIIRICSRGQGYIWLIFQPSSKNTHFAYNKFIILFHYNQSGVDWFRCQRHGWWPISSFCFCCCFQVWFWFWLHYHCYYWLGHKGLFHCWLVHIWCFWWCLLIHKGFTRSVLVGLMVGLNTSRVVPVLMPVGWRWTGCWWWITIWLVHKWWFYYHLVHIGC